MNKRPVQPFVNFGDRSDDRHHPMLVGVRYTDTNPPQYGVTAEIYRDDDWVYICTDKYDSKIMMNLETIDYLVAALKVIQADISQERNQNQ